MAQNVFVQQLIVDANNNYNSFNINHLNLILMYKVTEQIVNAVGNVQTAKVIATINCDDDSRIREFITHLHGLAKSKNYYYSLRGRQDRIRYVVNKEIGMNIQDAIALIKSDITRNISTHNEYIDMVNTAYKRSNKINHRQENNELEHIEHFIYMMDDKRKYIEELSQNDFIVW